MHGGHHTTSAPAAAQVRNDGTSHVRDVPVALTYDERLYRAARKHLTIPLLVPSLSYTFEVGVNVAAVAAGR